MAVRSRRLWGPTAVGIGGATVLYTVPAGRTAIIYNVEYQNQHSANQAITLYVNGTVLAVYDLGALRGAGQANRRVLNPGDVLSAQAALGPVHITGSGTLLEGAPS